MSDKLPLSEITIESVLAQILDRPESEVQVSMPDNYRELLESSVPKPISSADQVRELLDANGPFNEIQFSIEKGSILLRP